MSCITGGIIRDCAITKGITNMKTRTDKVLIHSAAYIVEHIKQKQKSQFIHVWYQIELQQTDTIIDSQITK